jgi:hypothetical protein
MDKRRRSNIAVGVILILVGAFMLIFQFIPAMREWIPAGFSWPLIIVGFGLFLLLLGLFSGSAEMAVPAAVFMGIGGILYWQNATGNWESWAYVWTLIPGFVGVGVIVSGLISGKVSSALRAGIWQILISLVLFFIFGSFLGGLALIGPYWPVLLIALGVVLLLRLLFSKK